MSSLLESYTRGYELTQPESVVMLPPFGPIEGQKWFDQISQPMRVAEEPVCIDLFRQNAVLTSLHLKYTFHVIPPKHMPWCASYHR
jgi:hypothetical protein